MTAHTEANRQTDQHSQSLTALARHVAWLRAEAAAPTCTHFTASRLLAQAQVLEGPAITIRERVKALRDEAAAVHEVGKLAYLEAGKVIQRASESWDITITKVRALSREADNLEASL